MCHTAVRCEKMCQGEARSKMRIKTGTIEGYHGGGLAIALMLALALAGCGKTPADWSKAETKAVDNTTKVVGYVVAHSNDECHVAVSAADVAAAVTANPYA